MKNGEKLVLIFIINYIKNKTNDTLKRYSWIIWKSIDKEKNINVLYYGFIFLTVTSVSVSYYIFFYSFFFLKTF